MVSFYRANLSSLFAKSCSEACGGQQVLDAHLRFFLKKKNLWAALATEATSLQAGSHTLFVYRVRSPLNARRETVNVRVVCVMLQLVYVLDVPAIPAGK